MKVSCKHSHFGQACTMCKANAHAQRLSHVVAPTLSRMVEYERAEYDDPRTYHTGNELPELWEFFSRDVVGDVAWSVKENLETYIDADGTDDIEAVY